MGFFDSLTSTLTSLFDSPWDLHEAANRSNIEQLNALINKYKATYGLDYLNHQRWTPLSNALLFGEYACVIALLKNGANPAVRNNDKEHKNTKSALEHALARKDYPIFRVMLFFWDIPKDINNCELMKFATSKKVVALNPTIVKDILLEINALKTLMQEIKTGQETKTNKVLNPRDRYTKIIQVAKKFEELIKNESNRPAIRELYRERAFEYYQQGISCLQSIIKDTSLPSDEAMEYKDKLIALRDELNQSYSDFLNPEKENIPQNQTSAASKSSSEQKILSKLNEKAEESEVTEETSLLRQRR